MAKLQHWIVGEYGEPVLYSHEHYTYTYTCRNIFNTIRASDDTSSEKYTSHFIESVRKGYKGYYCVRGELETEQNCNILTPTLMAITAFLSCSPGMLNRGPGGPFSLGHGPHSSIFSPTDLNFLSPGLYNNSTSTLLPASVTISHSIQPLDSQGRPWSPDIPRPDAPVIYTCAFLLLTAWPGRRSIYNTW